MHPRVAVIALSRIALASFPDAAPARILLGEAVPVISESEDATGVLGEVGASGVYNGTRDRASFKIDPDRAPREPEIR